MVLCLVTLTDLQTRRAGLFTSAELLVKSKLIIWRFEKAFIAFNNTMFKNFWGYWTNGKTKTPKVVTCKTFAITILHFRYSVPFMIDRLTDIDCLMTPCYVKLSMQFLLLIGFLHMFVHNFYARRLSVERNSYSDVAGWVAGWLSVTAGIVSKRLNVSENIFDHLIAPS